MKIWIDGKLVPAEDARVSVMDHGLLYGDGCFEGIRIYNGRIFKLHAHLRRMWASASELRLEPPYSHEEIEQAIRETVKVNGLTDGYIRLVFTRGVGTLGLHPFKCPRASCFIVADAIALYPQELYDDGMHIIVAKHRRVPVECLDPAIKSLNYLNNILAKIEANVAGVDDALMLDGEGFIAETNATNVFAVRKGTLVTPTAVACLPGLTRQLVLQLARGANIPVEERRVSLTEFYTADEVFTTGTMGGLAHVVEIDGRRIGASTGMGPVTERLQDIYRTQSWEQAVPLR